MYSGSWTARVAMPKRKPRPCKKGRTLLRGSGQQSLRSYKIIYNVLPRSNIYAYSLEKYLAVNSVSTQRASRPVPAHHRIASSAHLARRAERKIGIPYFMLFGAGMSFGADSRSSRCCGFSVACPNPAVFRGTARHC